MRALVLSYWNVNRPVTGGLRRVNALLEALGPDLVLCQPEPAHPRYDCVTFPCDLGRRRQAINWGLFNFFHPRNARVVQRVLRDRKPAVIVLTSIWTFRPVRKVRHIPLVLDAHDVLAVAMAERYGRRHPFTTLVRGWERRVARRADHVFACSSVDRDHFIRLYGLDAARITVVPNGVEVSRPPEAGSGSRLPDEWARRLADSCVLFFMGKPSYQPNTQGLKFLSDIILPELERRQAGRFKLVVCGGAAPPGNWHPAMFFAGLAPDELLRALLGRADICLAPTFTGSGTRLKVLEYLAAGKPVVSTPKGVEGLPLDLGREIVLAEAADFVEAILSLAEAPDRRHEMGRAGYAFVRDRYDWASRIQPLWRQVFDCLVPP